MPRVTLDDFFEDVDGYAALSEEQQDFLNSNGFLDIDDTESKTSTEVLQEVEDPVITEGQTDVATAKPEATRNNSETLVPIQVLEESRHEVAGLRDLLARQTELINKLAIAQAKDEKVGDGSTTNQDKTILEYEGKYPDVFEDLKGYFGKPNDSKVVSNLAARVDSLTNVIERQDRLLREQQISIAHPDAAEILSKVGGAFDQWMAVREDILDPVKHKAIPIRDSLASANVHNVIQILNQFKSDTSAQQPQTQTVVEQDAKKPVAVEKKPIVAEKKPPGSMTDIGASGPSGAGQHSVTEILRNGSPSEVEQILAGMTPSQREAVLAQLLA